MNAFTRHWAQRLRDSHKPAYLLIPDLLAEDVASGRLSPGDRLPPLRELATALGLNYTTVARGLAEAQKRGQIDARPGRGSFVRGEALVFGEYAFGRADRLIPQGAPEIEVVELELAEA